MKSQSLKSLEQSNDKPMLPKRRIHLDGVQMLDTHYVDKEINEKFTAIKNRVQWLQFEELRAKQQMMLAEQRQSEMLSARQRHYEDLMNKKEWSEMKLKRREAQRQANLLAKEQH